MAERIKILDSLRGIAALIVVFHHIFVYNTSAFEAKLTTYPWLLSVCIFISDLNHLAVLFFFVLSGFAIALATQNIDIGTKVGLNLYLYRRLRRILPMYWFAILFTIIIGLITGLIFSEPSYAIQNLLGNLLFLQTSSHVGEYWFSPYGLNGPLWSLSYEMFFYLFFPLYLRIFSFAFQKRPEHQYLFAVVFSFPLALIAMVLRQWYFVPYLSFLTQFPIWLGGYFLGHLYCKKLKADWVIFVGFISVLLGYLLNLKLHSETILNLVQAYLLIVFPGYILYGSTRLNQWLQGFGKLLNLFFMQLGGGSYAIYLLHYPLILWFTQTLHLALWLQLLLICIVCLLMVKLELWMNRFSFSFFKRQYV